MHVVNIKTHGRGSKSLVDVDDDEHKVDRCCEKQGGGMLIALRWEGIATGQGAVPSAEQKTWQRKMLLTMSMTLIGAVRGVLMV
jgi:hypothetical protein